MMTPTFIASLIQLIAVIGVGFFFSYRFLTGWMSANMDIAIEPLRVHLNEQEDYLAVIVRLGRGEYGALQLGAAELKVTYVDSTTGPALLSLAGTERLANSAGKLDWKTTLPKDPLTLHAKEKSQFAATLKVPRRKACIIEVTLLTHRKLDGFEWLARTHWGQRRSSSVSLPLSEINE
jgi:hypothetical protein